MISVFGSDITDAEVAAAADCLKSQWMGFGKKVDSFESTLCEVRNLKNMTMVDSGSNALYLAIVLLNLPPGSEIIVPSFTWVSCAQSIILAGHKPVFCDVDISSMNVNADLIEPHISPKTAAIMVVHYAGLPVDIDPIKKFSLPIIEDAAHAVCSNYKGLPCGGLSDVGIFSFDSVKNLAVGEGGGVVCNSQSMVERARRLRYCGIGKSGFDSLSSNSSNPRWWEYNISEPFIKMLPTNIAASIGLVQLQRLEDLQSRRKYIWQTYHNAFADIDTIITPLNPPPYSTHSYFTYCIRTPLDRDLLAKHLLSNDIYTTLRYHPLHLNPLYQQTQLGLPNSLELNQSALSLPLHPRLTDSEVTFIIDKVLDFVKSS